MSADDLVRKELNAKSRQTFYNYVLGEPYQDLSFTILPRDVVDMRRTYLPEAKYDSDGYEFTVAGIDWG